MKEINGKIVQVTESELRCLYFDREMYDVMSFDTYRQKFIQSGCVVVPDEDFMEMFKMHEYKEDK